MILFKCLFAVGMTCFGLYVYELIQGNVHRYTRWKDLTVEQWFFLIGILFIPIGLVGLLTTH